MKTICILALLATLLCSNQAAFGLRFELIGPLEEGRGPGVQPTWPSGISPVIAHPSRVYWTGGSGEGKYYFKASAVQIGELIRHYAAMRLRDHQVFVKNGKPPVRTFAGDPIDYNVHFYHLEGRGFNETRKHSELAVTYDPTLTIYVDPEDNLSSLKELRIPDHVVVSSEIEEVPKGKATLPERELWYARVLFTDGSPAATPRIWTTVTLWDKDVHEGIYLGEVSREGLLKTAFSEKEIADLRAASSWLTLTVGNHSIRPRGDHPLLHAGKLGRDPERVASANVRMPRYYYGRLLFEDGSPAILDRKVWKGEEITVDFPYAGLARPDDEGYFQLFFTEEQLEDVKKRKAEKNVYVPAWKRPGHTEALFVYPVTELAVDKEKVTGLRIPEPKEN